MSELIIRRVQAADGPKLSDYYTRNYERFKASQATQPISNHSPENWARNAPHIVELEKRGTELFWFLESGDQIVGSCNLTNITYFPYWSAVLGYSIDGDFEGQGHMTRAVQFAIMHAFEKLKLHRIVAYSKLDNERSTRLLDKIGFQTEGVAKRYMNVENQWADHRISAFINHSFEIPK